MVATQIINQLVTLGCMHFCVAPGSRSTPLVLALNNHPKATYKITYDERSLAFYALGYAKAKKKPCAIITTSGTAVANLFPAIIEASQTCIPIIILSADRPAELRSLGSNQVIDQQKIFGNYVRYFWDCPTLNSKHPEFSLDIISAQVNKAYNLAINSSSPGPVHINCQFREPLFEVNNQNSTPHPVLTSQNLPLLLSPLQGERVDLNLSGIGGGLILIGALDSREEQEACLEIINKLKWQSISCVTSGLRFLEHTYLDHSRDFSNLKADCVLHLGGRFVSKEIYSWLEKKEFKQHIRVSKYHNFEDPSFSVTRWINCKIDEIATSTTSPRNDDLQQTTFSTVSRGRGKKSKEAQISQKISQINFKNKILFLGNSSPIRDFDNFALASQSNDYPICVANRGASGIDGIISTAVGYAEGAQKELILVLGDMSFLYDLNGLALLKESKQIIKIILINNQGNGIFKRLKVSQAGEAFENFFLRPHDYNLEKSCEIFGISYSKTEDFLGSLDTKETQVIEIHV